MRLTCVDHESYFVSVTSLIGVNDEYPTPVQGDTRNVKGLFDTFMQNFAQMSKTMSSVQKN